MISIVIISKDEPELEGTLADVTRQAESAGEPVEVIVVDASQHRLDSIAAAHPEIRWETFERPPGVTVSIPHQRNAGVRMAQGDIIVFTDAGCRPDSEWLARMLAPIRGEGEDIVAGLTIGPEGHEGRYDEHARQHVAMTYLDECGTGNLAFRRKLWEAVGGFDEAFEYGSDVDFAWRLIDAGNRIRSAPQAVVSHHWGDQRRQLKRSYVYGKARARLYRKHRSRRPQLLHKDRGVVAYSTFLVGLPVMLLAPLTPAVLLYPTLLLIPAWRNRRIGAVRVVIDRLAFGGGVLAELCGR